MHAYIMLMYIAYLTIHILMSNAIRNRFGGGGGEEKYPLPVISITQSYRIEAVGIPAYYSLYI